MSSASLTSFPNSLDNSFATGASENSFFTCPFGLPKCEHSITLHSLSNKYFIVGNAPTILLLSVMLKFSSSGTLKSHLTSTFFPLTSISLTVFLLIQKPPSDFLIVLFIGLSSLTFKIDIAKLYLYYSSLISNF